MRKSTKLLKRFAALFLVVLMSINSFAAVVSDNDGAAFITKAEFDSLKNTFQSTINTYNRTIDNKIENAIQAYLAGIIIEKTEKIYLPLADWKTVTMMNGTISPTFTYPSLNLFSSSLINSAQEVTSGDHWTNIGSAYAYINYTNTSTTKKPTVRNVVQAASPNLNNMTWDGLASGWKETFTFSHNGPGDWGFYAIETGYNVGLFFYQACCFKDAGYYSDVASNWNKYWAAGWSYWENYSTSGGSYSYNNYGWPTAKNVAGNFDVVCDDQKTYNHILNFNTTKGTWEVYDKTWLNTLRLSGIDTLNANNWFDATSSSRGSAFHFEKQLCDWNGRQPRSADDVLRYTFIHQENGGKIRLVNYDYKWEGTSYKIPHVGLVAKAVKANAIYQDDVAVTQTVGGGTLTSTRVNLLQGFVVGAARKGDTIVWEPTFKNISSTVSGFVNNGTEVTVILAALPWAENWNVSGTSPANYIRFKKINGVPTTANTATTTDRKVKLEFEMPQDGFIYLKFAPAGKSTSELSSNQWQVDLDIENSNSYFRTPKTK